MPSDVICSNYVVLVSVHFAFVVLLLALMVLERGKGSEGGEGQSNTRVYKHLYHANSSNTFTYINQGFHKYTHIKEYMSIQNEIMNWQVKESMNSR